ncbi:hypothetical protein NP493_5168g00000 [Ridgeia piscesae]|uniref:Uncharacterized protein n=1 Tax=Ridgeia piscesae TaxID=27915 RepID=A0AAD9MRZ2_RIDPI|nr:hypothetical protein NP493_5168g00000 [Ridgeia piscesae]
MLATASGSQANGVKFKFVVIGGGIAGVTCVEMLSQLYPDVFILLITASPLIKTVTNVRQVTEMIQDFDVTEELPSQLESEYVNVTVVQRQVASLDSVNKVTTISINYSLSHSLSLSVSVSLPCPSPLPASLPLAHALSLSICLSVGLSLPSLFPLPLPLPFPLPLPLPSPSPSLPPSLSLSLSLSLPC